MRRTFITLLATAAFAVPAVAASNATNDQPQQQSQTRQGQNGASNQQASSQQAVSPGSLSTDEMKQVQTALNNDGFKAGRPDGKWGPRTRQAVQKFDQSKGIQSKNGKLTGDTLAKLGVNTNQQGQNSQQPQQNSGNDQNNSAH